MRDEFYIEHKSQLAALRDQYSDANFQVVLNENKFQEYYSKAVFKNYKKRLRENSLTELLQSNMRKSLIQCPGFSSCQMQCRNQKLNQILNELMQLPEEDALLVIAEKAGKKPPMHVEFW